MPLTCLLPKSGTVTAKVRAGTNSPIVKKYPLNKFVKTYLSLIELSDLIVGTLTVCFDKLASAEFGNFILHRHPHRWTIVSSSVVEMHHKPLKFSENFLVIGI